MVYNASQKRREASRKSLPDALDLMVICAEAGLSLDATLMRVAEEMQKTAPELSAEFSLTGLELGFLPDRRPAMQNRPKRPNLTVLRGIVGTLLPADRYGPTLARSFAVLSAASRPQRTTTARRNAPR